MLRASDEVGRNQVTNAFVACVLKIQSDETGGIQVDQSLTSIAIFGNNLRAVGTASKTMHYSAKLRAELSASKIRCFRCRGLRYDLCNGFAAFADVNLTELGGLSDPFTSLVVKLADRYRLHVTQSVTLT